MKKTLLSLIALFITTIAFAERVEIDGIYYNLDNENKTAEVTYQYQISYNNYSGATTLTIPSSVTYESNTYSVTSIGNFAFYQCLSLTSITIPNSVTSISDIAFYQCSSLTSITIPNSITSIGAQAFQNCSSLTSITIPSSVTSIGGYAFYGTPWLNNQPDGCVYAGSCLYAYKGAMPENTHIDVKEGTTHICYEAFRNCSSLTSITIPNSVTSIGDLAFASCSSLSSITIPNNVTLIGSYAFYGTPWLNNQPDGCVYAGSCLYGYKGEMPENTHINIKEGTTHICYEAFRNCSSLTSITIPNSVTSIGDLAFASCSSLTSITIPNSVTTVGFGLFSYCTSLKTVDLSNNITELLGYYASSYEIYGFFF